MDWDAFPCSQASRAFAAYGGYKVGEQSDFGMVPEALGVYPPLYDDFCAHPDTAPNSDHETAMTSDIRAPSVDNFPPFGMHVAGDPPILDGYAPQAVEASPFFHAPPSLQQTQWDGAPPGLAHPQAFQHTTTAVPVPGHHQRHSDGGKFVHTSATHNPYAKPRMTFRAHVAAESHESPHAASLDQRVGHAGQVSDGDAALGSGSPSRAPPPTAHAALPKAKKAGGGKAHAAGKQSKVCFYDLCPSPGQSNKWRTVTEGTAAGGQNWDGLMGKTLCDSCYSTFRKHGTLVRSIRTPEGWTRLDSEGRVQASVKGGARKRPIASPAASTATPPSEENGGDAPAKRQRGEDAAAGVSSRGDTAPAPDQAQDASATRSRRHRVPSLKLRGDDASPASAPHPPPAGQAETPPDAPGPAPGLAAGWVSGWPASPKRTDSLQSAPPEAGQMAFGRSESTSTIASLVPDACDSPRANAGRAAAAAPLQPRLKMGQGVEDKVPQPGKGR
mmetsp:Transcript_12536/g.29310  ORF Transcript_12536/g.29310 Transcript_12536/m.29310 type:complete len:500 (+) Transcript_12536:182-1681(+)